MADEKIPGRLQPPQGGWLPEVKVSDAQDMVPTWTPSAPQPVLPWPPVTMAAPMADKKK